ncbi:MAG: hypothetical protein JWO06_568 [Bacteroidota bacterium]|nr:hypothetical protein [Bacteroidota bacterium]
MKTDILYKEWVLVTSKYCTDQKLTAAIFNDLLQRYNESGRYYHNLTHIQTLLDDLREYFENAIPDEVFFAIWFHDAIYNTLLGNNEKKSAELAIERLNDLSVPQVLVSKVESLILKTALHLSAESSDIATKVFLDADLKVLGISDDKYLDYTRAVRKEFSMFPDILFNRGRKKFIENTLAVPRIYKTEKFFDLYEQQARKNLQTELNLLS